MMTRNELIAWFERQPPMPWLGDKVKIASDIEGTVVGVYFYPETICFEIAWIHEGERKTATFTREELQ